MRGQREAVETAGAAGTDDLVLEIPPEPEHARTARLFVAAAARHYEIDEERIEDLKVAISEAATNAIKAHAAAGMTESIVLTATPGENGVLFTVVDHGAGFDPEEALRPADEYTPPMGLTEGSLGLAVIRSLFPDSRIESNAAGTRVSIDVERPASDSR